MPGKCERAQVDRGQQTGRGHEPGGGRTLTFLAQQQQTRAENDAEQQPHLPGKAELGLRQYDPDGAVGDDVAESFARDPHGEKTQPRDR